MVRLDINEIEEEAYDQNNNINVWSELTMDTSNREEHQNGRGRMPEIYNPYTWDNGNPEPTQTKQRTMPQATRQQVQPSPQARPAITTEYDEILLQYNVQIVNGKMRYVDPTKGITVPPKAKTPQTPTKAPITKSTNDQCTTKQCPFKKPTPSVTPSAATRQSVTQQVKQRSGNMFGKRVAMMQGRSKKLIM
jgi:hypothetical protein